MKLRAAREKSGKTQAQAAKETGISVRVYQYYEAGIKLPRVDVAIRIARIMGTTVEELFGEVK